MINKNTKVGANKPKRAKLSAGQYEDLGRIVASVYETGYLNDAQSYKNAFFKGMIQGFGGVLGATVLVALLIWTLSLFNDIPLLGNVIENIQNTVDSRQPN